MEYWEEKDKKKEWMTGMLEEKKSKNCVVIREFC